MITKIPLDKKNRMLRAGFGKHNGDLFIRIDLWWTGFRLTGDLACVTVLLGLASLIALASSR